MKQLNLFQDQKEPEPAIYVVTWLERETRIDNLSQKLYLTGRIIKRGGRLRRTYSEAARFRAFLVTSCRHVVKAPKIKKAIANHPQTA